MAVISPKSEHQGLTARAGREKYYAVYGDVTVTVAQLKVSIPAWSCMGGVRSPKTAVKLFYSEAVSVTVAPVTPSVRGQSTLCHKATFSRKLRRSQSNVEILENNYSTIERQNDPVVALDVGYLS